MQNAYTYPISLESGSFMFSWKHASRARRYFLPHHPVWSTMM